MHSAYGRCRFQANWELPLGHEPSESDDNLCEEDTEPNRDPSRNKARNRRRREPPQCRAILQGRARREVDASGLRAPCKNFYAISGTDK